ncbi:hypothetical protein [Couchioplanes caeruleus]|uniref:Uncharacterized protein n=2 Tax=Couchioplanes caeruleus TaxID=56438 RepID=A0A1K0GMB9_9ACTN|nr:hypothetical protein [Couchioplanes caeruleus]OJF13486.1 hypothetical protein BG844_15030 [Couchioplanes caeruleus subsp. caeruleus]ROP28577.1 hypothetical protein EDD30_1341 [Couchioplanes caeruleus]
MTGALDPAQGVLGEPPAPPPEVWAAVLARALDPQAPPIDATGLVPDPAQDDSPADVGDDDTGWSHPPGQLTEATAGDHDDAEDLPPLDEPWSSGTEPEMY